MNSKFCADIGQQKLFKTYALSQNMEQLFHKPKLKWKAQPRTEYRPLPRLCHCLQQLPRRGPLTELAIPFGAWLKYPHVRNILNIYKDISKNALGMFCCCCRRVHPHTPRPLAATVSSQRSTVSQAFAFCRMFCSFFGWAAEREVQLQMRHEGCPVAGNKGEECRRGAVRGAVRGTVNGLRHLSACVLLGKCQKPLVKKPYGNYSTQLNMKCGKGSAVSPGIEGRQLKKVAALGK